MGLARHVGIVCTGIVRGLGIRTRIGRRTIRERERLNQRLPNEGVELRIPEPHALL
jgi:hypothetical protein